MKTSINQTWDEQEDYIINDILQSCNEAYSNGDVYTLSNTELFDINTTLNLQILQNEVTDQIYDKIYYAAKLKWPDNEFFNKVTSVNIGYGQDVELQYPAGSLTECKPFEIEKWLLKFNPKDDFICSHKLDGLSLIMIYDKGILQQAITRGDGHVGKDVTRHIKSLSNVPQTIPEKSYLVIRGECICPKKDIDTMLVTFEQETKKSYKNGRNTIAGFLNSKNTIIAAKDLIHVVCYDIMNEDWALSNKLDVLKLNHFEVVSYKHLKAEIINTELLQKEFENVKNTSIYECDGVVITHNVAKKRVFETGTINPNNSRKFKTLSILDTAETVIEDITWQISKWGKFTPVLNVTPVELSGATISNVTGFNYKQVKSNGWGVGAKILIKRSGDVIPKVEQTLIPNFTDFNLPTCNIIKSGVDIYIDQSKEIPSQYAFNIRVEQIVSCAQALKIDFVGPGNVIEILLHYQEMTNNLLSIIDFFSLSEMQFKKVIGINGSKIYNSIHKQLNNLTESKFFGSTGIFGQGISSEILNKIEKTYGKLHLTLSELKNVNGLGQSRIAQINSHYDDYFKQHKEAIDKLHIIFKKVEINNPEVIENTFKVVFTGFRSDELKQMFEKAGGLVVDHLTKDVNLVVAKNLDTKSNKIMFAQKNGIKIISYAQAVQQLKVHL